MRVIILTGPKGSGKTTLLQQWTEENPAGGILSPVFEGERFFQSVTSGLPWQMEAGKDETATLQVGRYTFSDAAFKQAEATIMFDLRAGNFPLIIDEIGPLELADEGLHSCLHKVIGPRQEANLIVVVREGLATEVRKKYFEQIEEVQIITKEGFNEKARRLIRASR